MNFGYALGKGLEAGANAGAQVMDNTMREQAEMRAADRRLADQERLMAAQEMMLIRAEDRKFLQDSDPKRQSLLGRAQAAAASQKAAGARGDVIAAGTDPTYLGAETAIAKAKKPEDWTKAIKMDDDDKLRVQEANKSVVEAEKVVADAMKNLMPGDDPAKSQQFQYAQKTLRDAKMRQFKTHVDTGLLTPDRVASDTLAAAQGRVEVLQSLDQLATVAGQPFADKVAAKIVASDAWKAMPPQVKPGSQRGPQNPIAKAPPGSVTSTPNGWVPTPASQTPAEPSMPTPPMMAGDPASALNLTPPMMDRAKAAREAAKRKGPPPTWEALNAEREKWLKGN